MKKMFTIFSAVFLAGVLLVGCSTNKPEDKKETKQTTKKETIVLGVASSTQTIDEVEKSAKVIQEKLEKETGLQVELKVDASFEDLITSVESGKVDLVFLNSSSYVKVKEKGDIDVVVKGVRFGKDFYRAQYNVRADSNINSIEDLVKEKGLKWAYPDKTSTAGYLFPALQIMDMGGDINQFVAVETGGHDSALKSLLNGDVDFATTFEDGRTTIIKEYPNVNEKIKVIGYSDKIPNDNASISNKLSSDTKDKVKKALLSFSNDKEAMSALKELYGWDGISEAKDSDYDIVRAVEEKFPQK